MVHKLQRHCSGQGWAARCTILGLLPASLLFVLLALNPWGCWARMCAGLARASAGCGVATGGDE
jgi:hypothetical protein